LIFRVFCWVVQICTIIYILYLSKKIDEKFQRQMELEKKIEERKLNEQSVLLKEGMLLECLLEDENGNDTPTLICVKSYAYDEKKKVFVWELYSISTNQILYMEKFGDPTKIRLHYNNENACSLEKNGTFGPLTFFTVKKIFEGEEEKP
jgi:hypothetical protein